MKNSKYIIALVFVIISLSSFGQLGFIGKRVILSTDLYETALDRSLNAEVSYLFNSNINFVASFGMSNYNLKKPKSNIYNGDSFYVGQKGFNMEFRVLANSPYTGQIAPFGHYYGYGFAYSGLKQLANSTPFLNKSIPKENPFHLFDLNIFYGKSFILTQNMFISFDLAISLLVSYQADITDYELRARMPSKYIPMYRAYANDELLRDENNFLTGMYLKPSLKISYLIL